MAKKKYQSSIELLQSTAIDAITAGYLGLGAKADGLYIKTSAGVEGKIWHSGNDGATSGLDADLLDGQHGAYYAIASHLHDDRYLKLSGGTLTGTLTGTNIYARGYYVLANGEPTSNLGSPTIPEMALFDEQFNNKTAFYDISKLKFFSSEDGDIFTEITNISDTNKHKFLGGDYDSGIVIPNLAVKFRIELLNAGYCYLNALYMYWSSSGNTSTVQIWKKMSQTQVWTQVTSSDKNVSSWPGHLYLPFPTIPWSYSTSNSGYADTIRIEFTPTWNNGNSISLYRMQLWGGYPAGKRTIYTTDENQNISFPASIKGTYLQSTIATGTAPLIVSSTTKVVNLNAELLDDQHGSYYLDWNNFTNKPTSFTPSAHNHDDRYYTETESDAKYSLLTHNHDSRYPVLENGLIPSAYLPAYVDDVLEYATLANFPATGESGKIYIAQNTNITYRWSGSAYAEISASLALGETSSTAYRGDRGKIAYDHSQIVGGVHITAAERTTWNTTASALASHIGSGGNAHALASDTEAGFMSITDKATLTALSLHNHTFASLSDVQLTQLAGDHIIKWNGTKWVNDFLLGITKLTPQSDYKIIRWNKVDQAVEWIDEPVSGCTIISQGPQRIAYCSNTNNALTSSANFVFVDGASNTVDLLEGTGHSAYYNIWNSGEVGNGGMYLVHNDWLNSVQIQSDYNLGTFGANLQSAFGTHLKFLTSTKNERGLPRNTKFELSTLVNDYGNKRVSTNEFGTVIINEDNVALGTNAFYVKGTSLFSDKAVFQNGIQVSGLTAQLGNTRLEGTQSWKVQIITAAATLFGSVPAIYLGGANRTAILPAAGNPASEIAYWIVTGPTYTHTITKNASDTVMLNGAATGTTFTLGPTQLAFAYAAQPNVWHILTLR